MVSLDCNTTTAGGVTLVTLRLESEGATHVRVANQLDGALWPPRRQGVPAAGWDENGFEGVVDGTLALGYATPADPDTADRPARIVETRPPSDDGDLSPETLIREFGAGTPPRDAVSPFRAATVGDADGTETGGESAEHGDNDGGVSEGPPPAVTAWLAAVEGRLGDAEALASATSLDDATAAVEGVGGADEVQSLQDQLTADRETLRALARECDELADRVEAVEVPVETLARLA